uniref:RRM domain-containing protein n=1 Tax=Rhodosorus marinus TaxID=101924 RepID=A0A7S3A676_9RHOD|mmetsp:Transcript_45222/g.175563  ORF Transcript_45222/g.175563 Transcript_45222/m.175563 type:complete len:415 (+) Transcript_45222:197-1441(+)
MESEASWWYLNEEGKQSGPVTWESIPGDVLVWSEGLDDWRRVSEIEGRAWMFADEDGGRHGPLLPDAISKRVQAGAIDGLSLFWRSGMDAWKPASEIEELRELLVRADPVDGEEEDKVPGDSADTAGENKPKAEGEVRKSGVELLKDEEEKRQKKKLKREREKLKKMIKNNSSVYFAGIPPDSTEEEVENYFSKCGIVKPDPDTGKAKVKLYRDEKDQLKGDGVVTYLQKPSVDNAVLLLDGAEFKPGWKLEVRKAEFKIKGNSYISRPKRQKGVANAHQALKQKALGWNEGVDDGRGLRIVILKHCFDPNQMTNPTDYEDLREDMEIECSKMGEVEKVTVFNGNSEGVVAVKFKQPASAESCIEVMNERFFDGRKLEAGFFDGKSDFRVKETDEQRKKREESWAKYLENQPED